MNLIPPENPHRGAVLYVRVQDKNKIWLEREAGKKNMTAAELIDKIITRVIEETHASHTKKSGRG